MKTLIDLFRIRREERWLSLVALVVLTALNALTIIRYFGQFVQQCDNYHKMFVSAFRVSGFDPLTYEAVSDWDTAYNVYRHPLLAFFMYIPYLINKGLMMLTGLNLVQFVVAVILIFCSFYSFLFLYRTLREVLRLKAFDAGLLSTMLFSFAYVMVSAIVPDHFIMSMMMLLLTLYICGRKQEECQPLTILEAVVLFVFTAGISLNNGIKTYLAALFTNGRRFFRWPFLLLAVILPCALMWGIARVEYRHFVWPKEMARKEVKAKKDKELRAKIFQQYMDTAQVKDSAAAAAAVKTVANKRAKEKYQRDHQKIWNKNTGKPIAKGEFSRWTDISTPRWTTAVENLFGESLILHQDHLLCDVLRNRPVFVPYQWKINYVVEGVIVLLFLLGILCGIRSRLMWTALSFFLFDMALHVGLGFGINEIYIMTAHWAYVIPIAIGCLFSVLNRRLLPWLRGLVMLIVAYLFIYNGWLLTSYML